MRHPTSILLALAALCAVPAAFAVAPAAEAADRAPSRCRVAVTSEQSDGRGTFSATEILDLDFRVRLAPEVEGEHLLHVRVHTPNGHLYQTLTLPFSTDPNRAGSRRTVDGFPRPLAVRSATADGTVVARLPVAGTSIVHGSLYGKWSVEAFLDSDTRSCGRSRAFFLKP
ncbi:MAG: hypothetical protein GY719_40720 [bacterium]|nr:hypothetical protein [bacterium]